MRIDLDQFEANSTYNDWLDQMYADGAGSLNIHGFHPRPSEVLFTMSPDTYQAVYADYQRELEDDLKDAATSSFPSPIAYYFYRFDTGYENELQRLHFLRDTWESIVDVLHAIAVSECRHRGLSLCDPLRFSDLLSDKVAQRLLNIERIINLAESASVPLGVASVVSIPTLQRMRELNRSRNGFSHSAAQSESQARAWIAECYADVMEMLFDIRELAGVEILRYLGQSDGSTLQCEVFCGHGLTRTIKAVPLDSAQVAASQRYFRQGQLLVSCGGDVFSLLPFVFFREDASGHTTKLCLFRRTLGEAANRQVEYEIVGEATCINVSREVVQRDIDEVRTLFGLGSE